MKRQKVVLLLIMLIVAFLVAEPVGRCCGQKGRGDGTRMAQELGLTQEQQEQLRLLRQKHKAERPDTRAEVKALRRQIAEELKKSSPSRSKIKTLADKIGAIHAANAVRMADHMLEVKVILTPEQFSKMLDIKEQRGGHKKGPGKGPGGRKKVHGNPRGGGCCPQS